MPSFPACLRCHLSIARDAFEDYLREVLMSLIKPFLTAEDDISIIDLMHNSTAIDVRAWTRQDGAAESIEINLLSCELQI